MPSVIDKVGAAVAESLMGELVKLPGKALDLIAELVRGANASDDPQRYIERRLIADGSHLAAQATLDGALKALEDDDDPPTTVLEDKRK